MFLTHWATVCRAYFSDSEVGFRWLVSVMFEEKKVVAGWKPALITSLRILEVRRHSQRAPSFTHAVHMLFIQQNKVGDANQGAIFWEDRDLPAEAGFMTVWGQTKENKVAALSVAKEHICGMNSISSVVFSPCLLFFSDAFHWLRGKKRTSLDRKPDISTQQRKAN